MPVRKSKTLAQLRAGKPVKCCALGHFMPFFVHYAAKNGYHCIWLDLEHRAMGQREVAALLQLAMHEDIDIMLRPPHTAERSKLARYLEDGATGLMIPMQNTPEDVTAIVNKAKFPPLGDRGIDGADAAASFGSFCWGEGEHSLENWIKDTNRETFVCVQIETREALSNVDAITKVPGLDFVFVGPGDLGWRLSEAGGNVPGASHYFKGGVEGAIEKVSAACSTAGISWGLPCSPDNIEKRYSQGALFCNLGGEFGFVMKGLSDSSKLLDEAATATKKDGGEPDSKRKRTD